MERISVMQHGEYNGMWFDADKAEVYEENTYWDGNNHISKATGSQTEHEKLYLTASGKWVLVSSSQWQGSTDSAELVDEDFAIRWFAKNEYEDENIPESILKLMPNYEL